MVFRVMSPRSLTTGTTDNFIDYLKKLVYCSSESQKSTAVLTGLKLFLWRLHEQGHVSLLFPFLGVAAFTGSGPFLYLQSQQWQITFLLDCIILLLTVLPFSSTFKDLVKVSWILGINMYATLLGEGKHSVHHPIHLYVLRLWAKTFRSKYS